MEKNSTKQITVLRLTKTNIKLNTHNFKRLTQTKKIVSKENSKRSPEKQPTFVKYKFNLNIFKIRSKNLLLYYIDFNNM